MSDDNPDYAVGDPVEVLLVASPASATPNAHWVRAEVRATYTHQVSVRIPGADADLALHRKHIRRLGGETPHG